MAAPEILSAVAVAVSAGTLIVAYRMGVRRFDHERELDDRSDARKILAEGALELARTRVVLEDVVIRAFNPTPDDEFLPPKSFQKSVQVLDAAAGALEAAFAAIRIRFAGRELVIIELGRALKMTRLLIVLYLTLNMKEADMNRAGQVFEFSDAFDQHRDAYLAAAQEVVGVRLSP